MSPAQQARARGWIALAFSTVEDVVYVGHGCTRHHGCESLPNQGRGYRFPALVANPRAACGPNKAVAPRTPPFGRLPLSVPRCRPGSPQSSLYEKTCSPRDQSGSFATLHPEYTQKQKRQAEHIEKGYKSRGLGEDEAERRAWATLNKSTGGGRLPGGSGRGKPANKEPSKKGGKIGGQASASRSAEERSASAKEAAQTRKRNASKQESPAG
jgi:hypothetical protein